MVSVSTVTAPAVRELRSGSAIAAPVPGGSAGSRKKSKGLSERLMKASPQEGDSTYDPFIREDPTDYFDAIDQGRIWSGAEQPELRLMRSVFFDAVELAVKLRGKASSARAKEQRQELLDWVNGKDEHLFAFKTCCSYLSYEPTWWRPRLVEILQGENLPEIELSSMKLVGRARPGVVRKLTPEQQQEIIMRSRRGETLGALSKEWGVSKQYVSYLKARGIRGGAR